MKIKIGYFSQVTSPGGSHVYLRTLLEHLDYDQYEVIFFCTSVDPLLADAGITPLIEQGKIRVVFTRVYHEAYSACGEQPILSTLKARLVLAFPVTLRLFLGTISETRLFVNLFKQNPVDLIHFNDTGCEPPVIAARLAGLPRILGTYHVVPDEKRSSSTWVHHLIEWVSVRSMHYGIAVSRATKMAWVRRTGVTERRIGVIYNGIDFPRFLAPIDEQKVLDDLGIAAGTRLVGVPARMHQMKGHRYLFEAISSCQDELRDVVFLLLGDGELRAELEAMVVKMGIASLVRFYGHRSDVPDILKILDVVVLPSVALEALPYALIEAQISGKAVIASDFSGIPEIIEDGVTGILVPPGDALALGRALVSFVYDPGLCRRMGDAGRQRSECLFSNERMLAETFEVYADMLRGVDLPAEADRVSRRVDGKDCF